MSATTEAEQPSTPAPTAKKKKPLWWRIVRVLLAILLVLVLLAVAYVSYLWFRVPRENLDPMRPGDLTLSAPAGEPLTAGPFTVAVDSGDDPGITITQTDGATPVWFSDPGTAFLAAGVGKVDWKERYGFFWPDVERSQSLTDQSVDQVSRDGDGITISGRLSGGDVSAPYTMKLAPVVKSDTVTV